MVKVVIFQSNFSHQYLKMLNMGGYFLNFELKLSALVGKLKVLLVKG